MKPYWLCVLPLSAAIVVWLVRRWLTLATAVSLAATAACVVVSLALPMNHVTQFLGQEWALTETTRPLLACTYLTAAFLLAIAAGTSQTRTFAAPALATAGLLSAAVLLRSLLMAFLVLPMSLIVIVMAGPWPSLPAVRGACRMMVYATVPIPLMLGLSVVLEAAAILPDKSVLVSAAMLVVPIFVLWLTLFPFHGSTRLWAAGELPLAAAFRWAVGDWVVIYLLLALWRENPILRTPQATSALGLAGLVTATVSGVWAILQSRPSGLLACAAVSELGIAVEGVAVGSMGGLSGALLLLASRSAAILLATAALSSGWTLPRARAEGQANLLSWRTWAVRVAFAVGILSLAGAPPLAGFLGRSSVLEALHPSGPYLSLAWTLAFVCIVLGLVRTLRSSCQSDGLPSEPARNVSLLAVLLPLMLSIWVGICPGPLWGLVSEWAHRLLLASPL